MAGAGRGLARESGNRVTVGWGGETFRARSFSPGDESEAFARSGGDAGHALGLRDRRADETAVVHTIDVRIRDGDRVGSGRHRDERVVRAERATSRLQPFRGPRGRRDVPVGRSARSPSALRHLEEPGRERHLEFRDQLRREGARRFGAYWTLTTCADGRTLKCLTVVDEFTRWLAAAMIETAFIDPGKPWQNGTDEPFNGKFRKRVPHS